jgi:DNA-directed RNA polymerase subunit A"
LFQHRIHPHTICEKIKNKYSNIATVFSPTGGRIDIFLRIEEMKEVYIEDARIWYIEDTIIPELFELKLSGIDGIKNIYRESSTHIITEGSNLQEVLGLENVDQTRTTSNFLWDIYNVFGIEAARQFLMDEFIKITSEGGYINEKHIELLVSSMIQTGTILPITRQTMKNNSSSVLSKISFEEPLGGLVNAAFQGAVDPLEDSTSNIILGKTIKSGSGMMDIIIDMNKLK